MQHAYQLGRRLLQSFKISSIVAHTHISSVTLCIATAVMLFALPQPAVNKISASKYLAKLNSEYNVVPSFDQLEGM